MVIKSKYFRTSNKDKKKEKNPEDDKKDDDVIPLSQNI